MLFASADTFTTIPLGGLNNHLLLIEFGTIAANLAFLSQHWDDEPAEYSTSQSPIRWNLTRERFDIGSDGRIQVPEAPGLGISLDPATIEKFRVA